MIYLFIIAIIVTAGIITPYNTGNPTVSTDSFTSEKESTEQQQEYCGFGERDNCINIIPQNTPISINDIQGLEL